MALASVNRPQKTGFYRAMDGDQGLRMAPANVDPRESDLRRMPADAITTALAGEGDVRAAEVHGLAEQRAVLDLRGRPLWGYFLAAALGAIGLELALISWWRQ